MLLQGVTPSGETLTISGAATNASTQSVAVNWNEDVQ